MFQRNGVYEVVGFVEELNDTEKCLSHAFLCIFNIVWDVEIFVNHGPLHFDQFMIPWTLCCHIDLNVIVLAENVIR
jgi:hypothetical protein